MKDLEPFTTVKGESEGKYQSRGSKFFAYLFPMSSLGALEERIQQLKQEYIKARHFCYAYRVIKNDEIAEYSSDAGEPGGSSGPPILSVLKQHELLNVGCVVVRYFGGTKLGIPGLIEAYGSATAEAVENSMRRINRSSTEIRLNAPMKYQPHLLESAKRENFPVNDLTYTSRFEMTVGVPAKDSSMHVHNLLLRLSDRAYDDLDDLKVYLDIKVEELGNRFIELS